MTEFTMSQYASKDDLIAELEAENFALASHQCLFSDGSGLTGDDGGTLYCAMQKRIAELEVSLSEANSLHETLVQGQVELTAEVQAWRDGYMKLREALRELTLGYLDERVHEKAKALLALPMPDSADKEKEE